MNKVGVLVVTYNRLDTLKKCIESIKNQSYKHFDILAVNNGSTDGTLEWLSEQSDLNVISQDNLGGAGGFHTGIKYLSEHGYEYCWLMDDDVICNTDALEKLMETAERINDFGFLCSRVFGADGKTLMNVPLLDDRTKDGCYASWLDRIDEKLLKVKAATFVSILFPLKHTFELGLPIKDYFIWGDDSEFTLRLSQKRDCYLVCDSKVIHLRTISKPLDLFSETNPVRIKFHYYGLRNGFLNKKKYSRTKDKYLGIGYFLYLIALCLKRLDFKRLKIVMKAFVDGLTYNPTVEFPSSDFGLQASRS